MSERYADAIIARLRAADKMSRPKSPERIQRDLDKAIRKERRERKRQEREAKREARLKKQAVHEHVAQNGIPKVQSGGMELGIRDAIAYSPLVLCGGCGVIIRESAIIGDLCPTCKYGKEVESKEHNHRKEHSGDALTGVQVGPLEAQDERRHT